MTRPIAFTRPDERTMHLQPWTDNDLHEMSQVTDQDIERAKEYWQRKLSARWRGLLHAEKTT